MVWLKGGNFFILSLYFRQNRPGKFVLRYSRKKKGVNPFGKIQFLGLWKMNIFIEKKGIIFFYLEQHFVHILALFQGKNKLKKYWIFWPKSWVTPFGTIQIRIIILNKEKIEIFDQNHGLPESSPERLHFCREHHATWFLAWFSCL